MRHLTVSILVTLAVLLGSAGMSWGADFQKGLDAYKSGDYATALRELKPFAEQGDTYAQFNLGVMYEQGRGVPQNYKTAVKWWKLAAKRGNASAQFYLGVKYEQGQGVLQDDVYAHMWLNIAASQGDKNATKNRDILAKNMTPYQLETAQKLARNFVPKKSALVVIAKKTSPTVIAKKTPLPSKSGTSGSGAGSLPPCPTGFFSFQFTWTNCFGTVTYSFGDKYVGEFKDGDRHGQGTYTNADGSKYVGEFKDDRKHGQGTYTFADGRVEEGIWENGDLKYAQKITPTVIAKKTPKPKPAKRVAQTAVESPSNLTANLETLKRTNACRNCYLRGANLTNARLERADLRGADLQRANLGKANLYGADLQGAKLQKANLPYANLLGANLQNANLPYANLLGANLWEADLRGANLERADLRGAELARADLQGAELSRADLRGAKLQKANLYGSDLWEANLEGANLGEANLYGSDLREANLEGANLGEANLEGANLYGANLRGAKLDSDDLAMAKGQGAIGLDPSELDVAKAVPEKPKPVKRIAKTPPPTKPSPPHSQGQRHNSSNNQNFICHNGENGQPDH